MYSSSSLTPVYGHETNKHIFFPHGEGPVWQGGGGTGEGGHIWVGKKVKQHAALCLQKKNVGQGFFHVGREPRV